VANNEDLRTARELGGLEQWQKTVDKTLDDHHERIEDVEQWKIETLAIETAKRNAPLVAFSTMALTAVAVLFFVIGGFLFTCYLINPSDAQMMLSFFVKAASKGLGLL